MRDVMEWLLAGLLLVCFALTFGGCAIYTPQNIDEWLVQAKQLDASGCLYLRANSRPYADAAFLLVSTYGRGAPKFVECLEKIPPEARSLLP